MEKKIKYSQDTIVWNNFRNGNEKSFESLYDNYFSLLYSYGLQITSNKALVKDSIQDLFIELWKNRANLAEVKSIKGYLYLSLRRKIIKDFIKENKFSNQEISDNYDTEVILPHEFLMISDQLTHEISKRLTRSFQTLTKRQKEAIFLKYYDNMSYEDIAAVMSLKNVKYARTLIYRAIDVLKLSITKETIF